MTSIIVAFGKKREIGFEGKLLWHLPVDLKNFKKITLGHHIIMGRKTFESIGKALPGRTSIIITRQKDFKAENCLITDSVEKAIELAKNNGDDEAMIIGGGEIYKQSLEIADKIYLSKVEYEGEADTFFPEFDTSNWSSKGETSYPKTDKYLGWAYEVLYKNP